MKRRLSIIFTILAGIFFIVFGIYKLSETTSKIDTLFGVLMIVYGIGSIILYPDWKTGGKAHK